MEVKNIVKYLLTLMIPLVIYGVVELTDNTSNAWMENEGQIKVHFLDVGQGDATFIELPNSETMLIDSGESSEEENVFQYIKDLGYSKIDYVIGTHPHTDHIGGLEYLISNLEVDNIYMPKALSNTKAYENLLTTIKNEGMMITTAKSGITIKDEEHYKMYFVAPNQDDYSDLNNFSAILKIEYYNNKFIFMGDAEILSEKEITQDVSSDVIKVGHHGSISSSSQEFVDRVKAEYAIISVGENNQYDLPSQEVIKRWEDSGAVVYRTDVSGNIVVTSDGNNINVEVGVN